MGVEDLFIKDLKDIVMEEVEMGWGRRVVEETVPSVTKPEGLVLHPPNRVCSRCRGHGKNPWITEGAIIGYYLSTQLTQIID